MVLSVLQKALTDFEHFCGACPAQFSKPGNPVVASGTFERKLVVLVIV